MKAKNLYLMALLVAILDQFTKYLALSHLQPGTSTPIAGSLMCLTLVENRGGAFGLFQSGSGMLVFVTLAVVVAIVVLVRRRSYLPGLVGVSLALQLGGAVGNLSDRLRLHYVVDFVDLHVWPIFNIADVAITAGIFLLAYYLLFREGRRPETHAVATEPPRAEG